MVGASLKMIDDACWHKIVFIWKIKMHERRSKVKCSGAEFIYIKGANFTALPRKFSTRSHMQRWRNKLQHNAATATNHQKNRIINLLKILKNFFTTLTYAKRNDFSPYLRETALWVFLSIKILLHHHPFKDDLGNVPALLKHANSSPSPPFVVHLYRVKILFFWLIFKVAVCDAKTAKTMVAPTRECSM